MKKKKNISQQRPPAQDMSKQEADREETAVAANKSTPTLNKYQALFEATPISLWE